MPTNAPQHPLAPETLPLRPDAPWLAPLAGFSDLPFRLLCREYGAAVACTEMVSAKGLIYGLQAAKKSKPPVSGTEELLVTHPRDTPLVVQLFGAEPEFLARAVAELRERGFAWFDLNMGCSVPKVTRTGAGAALLKDVPGALRAAKAMLDAAGPGRVGFKMRLGWSPEEPVFEELGKALADLGAGWLTLHPRFARQGFSGAIDAATLETLVRAVPVPVLASGDLFTAQDAAARLAAGVSGVMFARGALENPAVFGQYRALVRGAPVPHQCGADELLALVRRHAVLARELTPQRTRATNRKSGLSPALLKMRTITPRYVKHLPGAKQLRLALTRLESWEELDALLEHFLHSTASQP